MSETATWRQWDWQTASATTSHNVWDYIYVPATSAQQIVFPTQELAPIDEASELEPELVQQHFYRLRTDQVYFEWQNGNLKRIDANLKKQEEERQEAIKKARQLLQELIPEEVEKLDKEKRLLIISKNGNTYELLADGRVNKLLPNGEKQGLCFLPKEEWLPTEDIILMKKMLLEECPEIVEEKANKVSAFPLIS